MSEFEVRSPVVFDVPPQTALSNVQQSSSVREYAVQPQNQFYMLKVMSGSNSVDFVRVKDYFITKIIISGVQAAANIRNEIRITNSLTTQGIFSIYHDGSINPMSFYEVNFDTPIFFKANKGADYLSVVAFNWAVGEVVWCSLFGFSVPD